MAQCGMDLTTGTDENNNPSNNIRTGRKPIVL